jgi:cystathionine beta-lyase/cystathionine gamma-synthase
LGYGRGDRRGIPDDYYRMSIGMEDPDDIAADLNQALERG